MRHDLRTTIAAVFIALAGLWPSAVCLLRQSLMSPIDRLLNAHGAWCGAPTHATATLLGHCPACWTGASAFLFASLVASLQPAARPSRRR